MTTTTHTADTVTLPDGVKDTTQTRAVYAAMLNGHTGSAKKISAESGVILARTRTALNLLKAADVATVTEVKVGETPEWSLVAVEDATTETPDVADEAATEDAPVALGLNERKRIAALIMLQHVGNLVEFWDEQGDERISADEARDLFGKWLQYVPGKDWDVRLGPVGAYKASLQK